ncbi:MAG TPA: hypothetical protein VF288_07535 [Mycobacteriales bacterium]
MRLPTAPLVASGLVGGFAVGQRTGRRDLAGVLFGALGAVATASWLRAGGVRRALPLAGLYVGAMGGSHPLAKRIGRWPAVGVVTTVTASAAYAAHDRR